LQQNFATNKNAKLGKWFESKTACSFPWYRYTVLLEYLSIKRKTGVNICRIYVQYIFVAKSLVKTCSLKDYKEAILVKSHRNKSLTICGPRKKR
jgi:hypothetical protein